MANEATITRGEAPTLSLTAMNDDDPLDLTGASLQTKFKREDGMELVIGNSAHTIVSAAAGTYTVTLTAAQTATLAIGRDRSFVTIATISSKDNYVWFDRLLTVRSPDVS